MACLCDRFVDDFFTAERSECAAHAKRTFARLVQCLMGETAIAEHKLMHGNPLEILGVMVALELAGVTFWPEDEKIPKWCKQLEMSRGTKILNGGDASSLAGRLSFGAQRIFRRMRRAMLMPIFKQIRKRTGDVDDELLKTLKWWLQVLREVICDNRSTK